MITKHWNGLLSHEIFRLCFICLCFIEQACPRYQSWYGYVFPVSVQKYGKNDVLRSIIPYDFEVQIILFNLEDQTFLTVCQD